MPESPISEKLLNILACPACEDRPKVEIRGESLYCPKCHRLYPIEDGVPLMLVDKATIEDESHGG